MDDKNNPETEDLKLSGKQLAIICSSACWAVAFLCLLVAENYFLPKIVEYLLIGVGFINFGIGAAIPFEVLRATKDKDALAWARDNDRYH